MYVNLSAKPYLGSYRFIPAEQEFVSLFNNAFRAKKEGRRGTDFWKTQYEHFKSLAEKTFSIRAEHRLPEGSFFQLGANSRWDEVLLRVIHCVAQVANTDAIKEPIKAIDPKKSKPSGSQANDEVTLEALYTSIGQLSLSVDTGDAYQDLYENLTSLAKEVLSFRIFNRISFEKEFGLVWKDQTDQRVLDAGRYLTENSERWYSTIGKYLEEGFVSYEEILDGSWIDFAPPEILDVSAEMIERLAPLMEPLEK